MPDIVHNTFTGGELHEAFHYVSTTDPGAVGQDKYWLDTSEEPYVIKRRNAANTAWISVGSVSDTSLSGLPVAAGTAGEGDVLYFTGGAWRDQPLHADLFDDSATDNKFTTAADISKLAGIEAGADVTDATNVAAAGAVMDTGNETIAGTKTFSSSPVIPTPTSDFHAATREYVDSNAGSGGGITVQDEGSSLATTATTMNFVGAGVTATGTGTTKTVTIPGGDGSDLGYGMFNVRDYGATGTTGQDQTTAIINAATAAAAFGSGATLFFPPGEYRCSQTIQMNNNMRIVGSNGGGSGFAGFWSPLIWTGVDGGTQIQYEESSDPFDFRPGYRVERMHLRAEVNTSSNRAAYGIRVDGRQDMFGGFRDLHCIDHDISIWHGSAWVTGSSGGLNQLWRNIRIDRPRIVGIYWVVGATDNIFIDGCTFDNDSGPQTSGTTMGGFMHIDMSHNPSGGGFHLAIDHGKFEVRTNIHAGEGVLNFTRAPMTDAVLKNDWYLTFRNCFVLPYTGSPAVTNYPAVVFDPPTDGVQIIRENCQKFDVVGVPSAKMSREGSDRLTAFDVIAPYTPGTGIDANDMLPTNTGMNEATSPRIVGGLHLVGGHVIRNNRRSYVPIIGSITATDYSAANGGSVTFHSNEIVEVNIDNVNATSSTRYKCVSAGTLGDPALLSGILVSTTNGSNLVTLTSGTTANLKSDQKIVIGGTPRWIRDVTGTTSFRLTGNHNATASGQSLSFSAPTFKQLPLDYLGTLPTYSATNVATDRSFNANSTTIDELADVLGTLIADLRTQGIVL